MVLYVFDARQCLGREVVGLLAASFETSGQEQMNLRATIVVLGMGLFATLAGCASSATIGSVTSSPADYSEREITLTGIVTDQASIPFVDRSVYRLQDASGSIWVLGAGDPPERNETRTVRGRVEKGLTIGTRTFGVLLKETETR